MMAHYCSILRKAVAELDRPGEDERYELYERARGTVVSRLGGADPPGPTPTSMRKSKRLALRRCGGAP